MPPRDYYLPQRALVSQQDSAMIERSQVPRSRFTNRWTHKTTFDAGLLYPFIVEEILPGDHMTYNVTAYLRMSTPLFPIFDNQRVDTFFFFVPNRLVWTNWVRFMGEQDDPSDSIAYTVPTLTSPAGGFDNFTLMDYMGIPGQGQLTAGLTVIVNSLPLRGYNLIYNTWFRDQNIIDSLIVEMGNGPDTLANYGVRRRAKAHDYFTSALPWPQKFTAPTVPLAGTAPITGIGFLDNSIASGVNGTVWETAKTASTLYGNFYDGNSGSVYFDSVPGASDNQPRIFADLTQATGVSINVFRQAFLVQQLLERDARGGTRYVELIKSHFGVTNPDFRLQRPEYIGGGQSPLILTPIAQTAPTTGVPLGALGAAGTAAGQHRASYAATEHGFIIGLINVRSELSYQQGINKMWSRVTRYDYYWPALAGLGEQAILRAEIYALGDPSSDASVFGYQERWHEYRTRVSEVSGYFRSTTPLTLDAWHLAQRFTAAPTLNATFINDTPPMTRILAAGSLANNQQYMADIEIQRNAVRPIPQYGTPVLLGRF